MKSTMIKSAVAMVFAVGFAAASMAAPVTAEGTGVGKHGDITVAVTFDAGKIQDIKIVKNAENPILAKKVFTDLKDQVVALSPPTSTSSPVRRSPPRASSTPSTTLRRRPA